MLLEVEEADKLEVQGPRGLSPLEMKAVELVFHRPAPAGVKLTEIVQEIQLEIVDNILQITKPWLRKVPSTYGNGLITISKSAFPYTQALNKDSTFDWVDLTLEFRDRKRTDRFRPGNMHYLSTLIFECAHHWQKKYDLHADPGAPTNPPYNFDRKLLKDLRLYSYQHASAAQIYFLIFWQVAHRRALRPGLIVEHPEKVPFVDLTSQSLDSSKNVGPVDRYIEMLVDFPHTKGQRILNREEVETVLSDFVDYTRNLWDRGGETPCRRSTQEESIDPMSQFYNPLGGSPAP